MVSQFIIDPMHMLDEGVTSDIVESVIGNHSPVSYLSKIAFDRMNDRFISFEQYTPSEFERKPRTLKEVGKFKGNEFRQLLNYTLPVMLKDFVSPQLYTQTLRLHVAIRLLQDENNYIANLPAARELIKIFIRDFSATYGIRNFKYNTHCLLHIADCVEKYGTVYTFAAYKFENHIRILGKMLRKNNLQLQQFYKSFAEISKAKDLVGNAVEADAFLYNNFILRPNSWRDGCCFVQPGIPIVITEIDELHSTIRGRRFLKCGNFFEDPVASMDNLGIILASNLSIVEDVFPIDTILYKYYCLPYEDSYVLTPILHTTI